MKDMKYSDKIHLVGRAGSIMSLCITLGIPALICAVYDIWPTIGEVVSIGSGLLAIFVPTAISEVFSYTPILGSACYIAFITGNVLNLKLPCAVSAMELADVALYCWFPCSPFCSSPLYRLPPPICSRLCSAACSSV